MRMEEFKATHHGKFLGVPVWLDMTDESCPVINPKFGIVGEVALTVMEFLFSIFTYINTLINPSYEPMFPILVGCEVDSNTSSGR